MQLIIRIVFLQINLVLIAYFRCKIVNVRNSTFGIIEMKVVYEKCKIVGKLLIFSFYCYSFNITQKIYSHSIHLDTITMIGM